MPRYFYEGTDSQLVETSAAFGSTISASPATYGLTAPMAASYQTIQAAYASAYAAAINPLTRTKAAVEGKNQARLNLVSESQKLSGYIVRTPTVTNQQLIELGLPPREHRMPSPVPSSAPILSVLSVSGRNVLIRLRDASGESRGKPAGTIGAAVFSHVGETAPANIADWKFEGNIGRTKVEVVFDDSIPAGGTVWLTAFWFNGRKESGVACTPVSVTFGGVGVSTVDNDMKLAA